MKVYRELRESFIRGHVDFKDPIQAAEPVVTKEQLLAKFAAKPKRKANPAAIEALRKYREMKKAASQKEPLDIPQAV